MNILNASTTFWPIDVLALATQLTSRLEAHRRRRRFALAIHNLRKLDPHILDDMGVNQKALYEPEPKIIDSDGRDILV